MTAREARQPDAAEALILNSTTGELWRVQSGACVELLGRVPLLAVSLIAAHYPYRLREVPLVAVHGYPPTVEWYPGKQLPDDLAAAVLAVIARSLLRPGVTA